MPESFSVKTKFNAKICCSFRDIEFFLNDCFYWRTLYMFFVSFTYLCNFVCVYMCISISSISILYFICNQSRLMATNYH